MMENDPHLHQHIENATVLQYHHNPMLNMNMQEGQLGHSMDPTEAHLQHMDQQGMTDGDIPKKRKSDKEAQYNTCLALGCERQVKQRRLCPMHQKQKERNGGKIELKENVKFTKGRTPTPFSKHANKYAKLKTFDKKIDEWAGGREEGTIMLESYIESSYHQGRFPKQEDSKIYEQIGKNIVEFMKQLPEKSPLRRPLIKAMSENVPLARLREVLPVSKQTVINSKKLSDQDNLLLTMKYKPGVTRNRKRDGSAMGELDQSDVLSLVGENDLSYHSQYINNTYQPPSYGMNMNTMSHMNTINGMSSINSMSNMNMNMNAMANMGGMMNPQMNMNTISNMNTINSMNTLNSMNFGSSANINPMNTMNNINSLGLNNVNTLQQIPGIHSLGMGHMNS